MTELNELNREANMKTVYLNAAYFPAVELLSAVGTAVILLYGGNQAIDGAIAIGVVVSFVGYLQTFFDPIQQLSQLYTTYQQGMAALDKIFDLLETKPDMIDAPGCDRPRRAAGRNLARRRLLLLRRRRLRARGSAGSRSSGRCASVDLSSRPARHSPWSGPPGAGKSTFAKLVARFYDPQAGEVRIDGHDLREVQQKALREQLGIVPQEGFLFSGTVRENIAFGRPEASLEEIERRRPASERPASSPPCPRASRPRSANGASSSPPASASSWPSPGRCWPSPGS